ncbi:MAG: hypothetical protein RLZZ623_2012 [Actinomycetota bacterium]
MSRELDAATIVGLLADDDRRRAFAALELGADTVNEIGRVSGLSAPRVAKAVGRLAEAGLVVDAGGSLHVMGAAFQRAARVALARPASNEHDGVPEENRRVMAAFVADGRLTKIPTSHGKRLVILDWLAQDFDLGRRYTEQMVNLVIGQRHADTAALRRYLVDEEFLAREGGVYWRIGGSTSG